MKRIVSHSPMSAALGAVAFLLAGCASVATQQAAAPDAPLAVASAPAALAEQSLHLATAPNFRDVGGYRTADGRRVRTGLIYRSDQLNRLSDADLATIGGLGLGLVVDLRTATERQREPDRIPVGAQPLVLDVAGDGNGSLGGDMRNAMGEIAAGRGVEMLIAANRDFVSMPSARAAYSTLLHRLADPAEKPLVYHCTAGKDRTGWASAIILTVLGVPRETVMADYLRSNDNLRAKNAAMLAGLKSSGMAIDPANLEAVMTVRPEFLQSAFDEVDRKYGSFDAYLRDGLGLTVADITALRAKYLTGG